MTYLALIDYKANKGNNGFDYKEIEAKNVVEAILVADHMINNDDIYLIKLMKKEGKAEKIGGGIKATKFKSFMVRRQCNWHASDTDGEFVTTVTRYTDKYGNYYEITA